MNWRRKLFLTLTIAMLACGVNAGELQDGDGDAAGSDDFEQVLPARREVPRGAAKRKAATPSRHQMPPTERIKIVAPCSVRESLFSLHILLTT